MTPQMAYVLQCLGLFTAGLIYVRVLGVLMDVWARPGVRRGRRW